MSRIQIGWASRDVSTDKPINIPGQFYMRISQGVLDPITVSSLVVAGEEDQVIFLSCDLGSIRYHLLDIIREKLQAAHPEIPGRKILMNCTHTHTGPCYSDDEYPPFDYGEVEVASPDEYREFFTDKCVEAIIEAWDKKAPGGFAYGYGYAVAAHSRRVCYFDDVSKRPGAVSDSLNGGNGHAVMYGNTNDDNFSHYEAGADHFINLLYTYDAEGKLTGAVVNVPCPSQNSEGESLLSASFWGDVRKLIHEKYGDIHILPQCAAAGDLSPRVLHYKAAQERRFKLKYNDCEANSPAENKTELYARKDIAERIVEAFDEVLSWAQKDIHTEAKISHVVKDIGLTRRLISKEIYEDAKAALIEEKKKKLFPVGEGGTPMERLKKNSMQIQRWKRYEGIIQRYEEQVAEPKYPMEMHVIGLGDIAFTSVQFEIYMDYQHRIQARSPFEQTFIVQLAAQPGDRGATYLSTQRGTENKGYSASIFCNRVSYEAGQEIVEEAVRTLKEIHE